VAFQTEEAQQLLGNNQVEIDHADDSLWRKLAALPLSEEVKTSWRTAVLPMNLPLMLEALGNDFEWQIGVGDGRVRALYRESLMPERLKQFREATLSAGGTFIIETEPASVPHDGSSLQSLCERINQKLDPNGIFPHM